jgi:hypothetical protein
MDFSGQDPGGVYGMEEQQLAKWIPPEQTRMVGELIRGSGIRQNVIARNSVRTAELYKELCPDLPDRLGASTISRMRTGSALRRLERRNLQLLHLTIHCSKGSQQEATEVSLQAADAANSFADAVLAAGATPEEPGIGFYDLNDPRHNRAADLFGDHGVSLIEKGIAENDADSFRKIAVLQLLSGNTDDARYWSGRAGLPESPDQKIAAQEAFAAGRWHLYQGYGATAEIYLALAAEAGHAGAAFMMGDLLEALQRHEEARRWFVKAQINGHTEADGRLSALK